MSQGIRTKIFIPVFAVLIIFPAAAFGIFALTSDRYMKKIAETNVEKLIRYVDHEVQKIPEFHKGTGSSDSMAREAAKELMTRVRRQFEKDQASARLVIFNTQFVEVYPDNPRTTGPQDDMAEYRRNSLMSGELTAAGTQTAEFGGIHYAAKMYEVDTDYNIKTKYFIAYEQILDLSQMRSRAAGFIAVFAVVLLAASGVMIWVISRSIIRPIEILCRQTAKIGTESEGLQDDFFSVRELEELRSSLCKMEQRLKESQEEKQQIFQNISHDLRTPLASIIGYAEGIRRQITENPAKSAEIILSESQRMNRMVDSILTISKLDSNAWPMNRVKLPLDEFLDEQTEILQGIAGHKRLVYAENEAVGRLMIETDPELLTRIFQNVVSNCLRHAESEVNIQLARQENFAIVTIYDDGPGIAKEDLEHIYERYYKGKKGEFGLGLSLVWSGIQYLGGKAEVFNREAPNHGAVYRLFFQI